MESPPPRRVSAGLSKRPGSPCRRLREVLARLPVERARAEKIFQILLREKTLVKVSEGLVFHRSALDRLRQLLAARKSKTSRIDVPAFKR